MNLAKGIVLFVSCATGIAACSSKGPDSSSSEDVGQASVAIMAAPADAACVEIDVIGARNIVVRKDVMPGQPTVFTLNGLPIGTDTFSGATFPVPCVKVPSQMPYWIADPVQAFLSLGSVAQVTLDMHRNGQASVGVNYTDDDGGVQCPTGSALCMGMCVPTQSDPNNCGGCGFVCPAGDACQNAVCTPTMCLPPNVFCAGACVNPTGDPNNCGACGNKCPPNAGCQNSMCVPMPCPPPQLLCGTVCVPPTDPNNCGACGKVCPPGDMCNSGVCGCQMGLTQCMNGCFDLQKDPGNCGACGHVCAGGAACVSGVCSCPVGMTLCGSMCIDTSTDPSNCGGCGNVCMPPTTCQAGACK
jgi:hypothetical protein